MHGITHKSFSAHLLHTPASGHKFLFHVKAPHIGPCQRKATHCRHGILTEYSVCLSDLQVDRNLRIWTTHPMAATMLRLQWHVNILEISISLILALSALLPLRNALFQNAPSHFSSRNVRHFSSRRDLSYLATRIEEILGGIIATNRDQNCRVSSRETRHFRCTVTICTYLQLGALSAAL